MLYSKYRNYVTGHGCAADYCIKDGIIELRTYYLPSHELNLMMPSQSAPSHVFEMKHLATTEKFTLIKNIKF